MGALFSIKKKFNIVCQNTIEERDKRGTSTCASKGFVAFIYGRRSDAGTVFRGPMAGLSRDAKDKVFAFYNKKISLTCGVENLDTALI